MTIDQSYPARVFVLIPENNGQAIVIRRGPAEQVGIFTWDTKTDVIRRYQWLKGRIYEYFSDISPDGKYFIYSANKKGEGYTVISRSPWLKAISYWRNVGGYGGGHFLDKKRYMLYDSSDSNSKFISKDIASVRRDNNLLQYGIYYARLLRRDWRDSAHEERGITFYKDINKNVRLEKLWKRWPYGANKKGKGSFWEYHRLVCGTDSVDKDGWEWCEWLNGCLVWAEQGCLYRSTLIREDLTVEAQLIHDFNKETFKEKKAPY